MTARSEDHGILFARDDFEYSLYLSIGRAQRERGGKATFGLKMPAFSEIAKEDVRLAKVKNILRISMF